MEQELYQRLAARCAATEYAPFDIELKVLKAGLGHDAAERIVDKLIDENYINEERYIRAFVHDKFAFNHWGKAKIESALRQKRISGQLVRNELAEIDEEEYRAALLAILTTKNKQIKAANQSERFKKLLAFAASRGFEIGLAYEIIEQNFCSEE